MKFYTNPYILPPTWSPLSLVALCNNHEILVHRTVLEIPDLENEEVSRVSFTFLHNITTRLQFCLELGYAVALAFLWN